MHRELIYLQTVRIAISLIFMIRIAGLIIRLMMDGGRMIHFRNGIMKVQENCMIMS